MVSAVPPRSISIPLFVPGVFVFSHSPNISPFFFLPSPPPYAPPQAPSAPILFIHHSLSDAPTMGTVTSSIAAKLAYFPPTPPSYTLNSDHVGKLRFAESMTRNMEEVEVEVEVVRMRTRKLVLVFLCMRRDEIDRGP